MLSIKNILTEIAKKKNVRVLFACETGSRAWGFPSPDSDYDIRFVYMHEMDGYLSLNQRKDTIEYMDGDLDITGWDLKKCLSLLKKSNAPLIERFQSPIEYFSVPRFKDDFMGLIAHYYSPTAVYFHHYSLARKFWEEIKGKDEFRLKHFFYLVRSLLSCQWILNDDTVLPMHIEGLMRYTDSDIKNRLGEWIIRKAQVNEKHLQEKDDLLEQWTENMFILLESKPNTAVNRADMAPLNQFFLKMLYANAVN